jgi:APA family basic amino acid/polyamine antiporter
MDAHRRSIYSAAVGDAQDRGLRRALGAWSAASLVVGTIIGTGVFLKTAVMAQAGSPLWVLAAWAVAGALSLAGALTYAELGAMLPEAGGEYAFLREGWGRFFGFLYGWTRFWIGTPGSIAAYAVGAATFAGSAFDTSALAVGPVAGRAVIALVVIAAFTAINCMNVGAGGRLNTALTALKVTILVALAGGALLAPHGDWAHLREGGGFPGGVPFSAMVLAALWAFDGWNNLPMVAGEVRDPAKNLPRALVLGTLAVLAIYAIVNLGYFHALPLAEIQASASPSHLGAPAVAAKVAEQFVGGTTQIVIALAMMVSALSAMNGSMLTGARVPYAMARDGLAPQALARVSAHARVPRTAVVVQGAWACVLALSGRFDDLTDAVMFASWLFYALNAGSVLLLRRSRPDAPRPFHVPGYPVVPLVFIALAAVLLVATLVAKPLISSLGAGVMALGAVVYLARMRVTARARRGGVR